jgi:TolB-like protein
MTRINKAILGAGIGAVLAGGAIATLQVRTPRPSPGRGSSSPVAVLTVEPFGTLAPAPRFWSAATFGDSLATHLARAPGLDVRLMPSGDVRINAYILRGDARLQDGRLMIETRLYETGQDTPFWTATYWGGDTVASSLQEEIAADVTGALYTQLTRHPTGDP